MEVLPMADKRVAIISGDIGSTAELIPVSRELEQRGVTVTGLLIRRDGDAPVWKRREFLR
ncbi:MAG: hypothetical protein COT71_02500 [Candidatus Andersenbacteria bacterium CG10_big_fil_rev_8_21_14_0_10_54_11]|uniref:Uncharacterized protein n=1 Tax=Candidatus Andersenbacteria bacterium CG10_big_fil_rev_8_21_14_0_10_54_11 TaxID=1974485 RepID=A0A2M6WZA6_9BACT|nr:MAG: hypothetical protein COT71_02500 [Candidatus Andersenbacteria bacterium CG10_big_fil_rev_8_21_14_0_10_54_11]